MMGYLTKHWLIQGGFFSFLVGLPLLTSAERGRVVITRELSMEGGWNRQGFLRRSLPIDMPCKERRK